MDSHRAPFGNRLCLLLPFVVTAGCALHPAAQAVKDGRIALESSERNVLAAAGSADLMLGIRGVETLYYRLSDALSVSVTLLAGKVVAFDDRTPWPLEAAKAAKASKKPVGTGTVRVGMTEAQVLAAFGPPNGLTAKDGSETLHWVTDPWFGSDMVDSMVVLEHGQVTGFWDRPVSEFTQNLPTKNRDKSTTGGRIRVGMTMTEIEKRLGAPDGKAGKDGITTYRYESSPFFGDTIHYEVGFQNGRVAALSEFNVTREEKRKKKEEAERLAAESERRGEAAQASIWSILNNPLVKAALGRSEDHASSRHSRTPPSKGTLLINGRRYTGGAALGQRCGVDGPYCPSGYSCVLVTKTSGMCAE